MASTNTEAAAWASFRRSGTLGLPSGDAMQKDAGAPASPLSPSVPYSWNILSTVLPFGACSSGCYRFRRGETGGGKANSRSMLLATSTLFWAISKALFTSSKA